ncbi:hypothetical protein WBG78_28555 [Chryseolinea sp. T2]|uniref:hypothetical protein n=1 Tax=Chryseolinea sp. T2 TaxID=3129255 RepID=UPI00307813F8
MKEDFLLLLNVRACSTGKTLKPGYIAKKEIRKIAADSKQSPVTLKSKLDYLVSVGFAQAVGGGGYTLVSIRKVNKTLDLAYDKKTESGVLTGKKYIPYLHCTLPVSKDQRILSTLFLYFLINEIFQRYQFVVNGARTHRSDNRNQETRPENFELSIEKIMERGNYTSKMQVWRLLNQLESVGLCSIQRGQSYGACNRITLHPLSSAKWSKLNGKREATNPLAKLSEILKELNPKTTTKGKKVKRIVLAKKPKKVPIKLNAAEEKFRKVLDAGLTGILCDSNVGLNEAYRYGRKISRLMFSKLLVYCLNDKDLRSILLTEFGVVNFEVKEMNGVYKYQRDSDLMYLDYNYHNVSLVESGGNYSFGQVLVSKGEGVISAKDTAYAIVRANDLAHARKQALIAQEKEHEQRERKRRKEEIERLMTEGLKRMADKMCII